MKLIGIDPGLASFAIAVANLKAWSVEWESINIIRTEPDHKTRRIRVADDTADRCRAIYRGLQTYAIGPALESPVAICIESTAMPFGKVRTSVVSALGRVRGLVDAFAEEYDCAVVEESPQALKKMLCGKRDASKDDVRRALEQRFPGIERLWPKQKTLIEHAADAAMTIVAGLESDVVKAACRAASGAAYQPPPGFEKMCNAIGEDSDLLPFEPIPEEESKP